MKSSASTGDDEISIVMLQNYLTGFSDVLLDVVNSSILIGQIPSSWKHAHVILIPKMKGPRTPADTRPISILPAISKFVEKLVQHQLVKYVETYHLMSEQQHGHREHRSTETALAVIADRVHHAKGRGDISNLTILDQSRGSVIVPHQTLLDKLSTNGIDTKWFHNYLEGHTQQVVIRRTDSTVLGSTSKSNTLGVYQGGSAVWSTRFSQTIRACTRQRVSLQYSMPTMSRLS